MWNKQKRILVISLLLCCTRFYAQDYSLFLRVDSLFFALELEHFGNISISSTISGMNKVVEVNSKHLLFSAGFVEPLISSNSSSFASINIETNEILTLNYLTNGSAISLPDFENIKKINDSIIYINSGVDQQAIYKNGIISYLHDESLKNGSYRYYIFNKTPSPQWILNYANRFNSANGLVRKVNDKIFDFDKTKGLIKFGGTWTLHNYLFTRDNRTFFGMMGGINYFDMIKDSTQLFSVPDIPTKDYFIINEDNDGNIWARNMAKTNLIKTDGKSSTLYKLEGTLHTNLVKYRNFYIIGTQKGVFMFDNSTWQKSNIIPKEFNDYPIYDILGNQDSLWFRSEKVVFSVKNNIFAKYDIDADLILVDRKNKIWFVKSDALDTHTIIRDEFTKLVKVPSVVFISNGNSVNYVNDQSKKDLKLYFSGAYYTSDLKKKYDLPNSIYLLKKSNLNSTFIDSHNNLWLGYTFHFIKVNLTNL